MYLYFFKLMNTPPPYICLTCFHGFYIMNVPTPSPQTHHIPSFTYIFCFNKDFPLWMFLFLPPLTFQQPPTPYSNPLPHFHPSFTYILHFL